MEAKAIYDSILDEQPHHPEILYLMSVLNLQLGRFDDAARLSEKAIEIKADEPNYFNISGEAHLALGDVQTAIARYKQAIAIKPDFAGAHNNLGNAYKQTGNIEDAVAHYQRAVELDPDMVLSYNNLGLVLKELGRTTEALDHFRKALSIMPNYAEAHSNLGNLLQEFGQLEDAVSHHKKALAITPGYAGAQVNLGSVLHAQGKRQEAIGCYQQAIAIDPNLAVAHFNLGFAVDESRRPEEAVEHYRRALSIDPDYAEAHNNLGNVLDELGQWDSAIEHYERARMIRPDYIDACRNLARLDPTRLQPSDLEERLASSSLTAADRAQCYFTLGIVYNEAKEFDKAFENFRKANDLERRSVEYDAAVWSRYVDRLIDANTEDFFGDVGPEGSDSQLPVFIVGMHRSGTSLVEQIVSSHPDVYGAGELEIMGQLESELTAQLERIAPYPRSMRECDQGTIMKYAGRYVDAIAPYSNSAKRVTDKMPGNFARIGLIRTLFPKCRIIHCTRNALDTCISNYFNSYATGNPYAYDLAELGQFYRGYEKLMAHWHSIFGAAILEVRYENLIENPEVISRQLIDYIGLEWDERCRAFNENRRAVNNLNSMAVHQPLYTSSINRWKRYEKHLQTLIKILNTRLE